MRSLDPGRYNSAQGKPLGLLLAWLASAHSYENAEDHMKSIRLPDVYICDHLTYERRMFWRDWLRVTHPDTYRILHDLEHGDNDEEPDGYP